MTALCLDLVKVWNSDAGTLNKFGPSPKFEGVVLLHFGNGPVPLRKFSVRSLALQSEPAQP